MNARSETNTESDGPQKPALRVWGVLYSVLARWARQQGTNRRSSEIAYRKMAGTQPATSDRLS